MTLAYSDEEFKARLRPGVEAEHYVAERLRAWGFQVQEYGYVFRDHPDQISDFTKNQTDLIVSGYLNVEVKSRTVEFTSPEDYPFADAAIEAKRVFESKLKRPDLYVIHSRPTGALVIADARQADQWVVRPMRDRARDVTRDTYFAPKRVLKHERYMEGFLAALSV
ncbi:hypothetical protein [Deinococcus kurensis]|uniref:hypothetical protein n=1 Tax=Deinococcus kurensis TaxID=2662757 RepID=UPI0012D35806|nr:hypothetical protein [Deinococcus kurensis]